ncbi:MAG: hypothetical protein ACPGUE_12010 [Marinomonas sp.]
MGILATGRQAKIAQEYTEADKNWSRIISQMTAATDLTIQATSWLHDNIQNNKGDVTEIDRVAFRASFEKKLIDIKALVTKLDDCYAVYDADNAAYQNNLSAFLGKYTFADPAIFDSRF